MKLYCPEGEHEIKVRFNPVPGERFCPEHGVHLQPLPKGMGASGGREGLPGEKAARNRFRQLVTQRPCFFLDRVDGEPRRPGHVCRYPLDAHHLIAKGWMKRELDLLEEQLVELMYEPLIGAPLCRAAHDAVEHGTDYVYWEELNPDLIEFCERFDAAHPGQRSLLQRLEADSPRKRLAPSGDREEAMTHE